MANFQDFIQHYFSHFEAVGNALYNSRMAHVVVALSLVSDCLIIIIISLPHPLPLTRRND